MKRILVVVALTLAAAAVPALASPVQQFSFQLTNVKPDGRFTILFQSRSFDTTGGVPPALIENSVRLPAGSTLRRQFLTKRFFCNGARLRDDLDKRPSGTPFTERVRNLKPFIRELSKSTRRSDRRALANALACDRGRIGNGTAMIDARGAIPILTDLIPAKFSLFLSRPTVKGGIAGFVSLGAADENSAVAHQHPIVTSVHSVLTANFVNDPSTDGLYGYKLLLPTGDINGFVLSIAELKVTTTGLTIPKGTCLRRGVHGRCVKRQRTNLFWFTKPACPASGLLSFQAFYAYAPPEPSVTKTIQLACPRFRA